MVIGAVARLPHREDQRQIGLLLILEARGDLGELGKCAVGVEIGIAILEVDNLGVACGLATLDRHVNELGDRDACRNIAETAATQDGGFERELWRDANAYLLLAR